MNRATVLIVCLAAAGAVGAYTHYSERPTDHTPVFTVHVPQRPVDPPPPKPQRAVIPPRDRASLTRALQRELTRVGCYSGEINGVWTTSSRMAMQSFVDQVNASLPIDNPDHILLSLVQGHKDTVCGAPCQADQAGAEHGRCVASTVDSRPATETPAREPDSKTTNPAVPAAAAAAALAASAAVPKGAAKEAVPNERVRSAAAPPDEATPKGTRPETRQSGPVPSERVYKNKHHSRRHSNRVRPPKIVRDIMRTLGIP